MNETVSKGARVKTWLRGLSVQAVAREIAGALARHLALVVGLLVLAVWVRTAPPASTLPESARAVYQGTLSVGTVWLCLALAWRVVATVADDASVSIFLTWFIERCVLFSLLLVAERAFGHWVASAIAAALARPAEALELGAATLLVFVVMRAGASRGLVAVAARGASMSAPGYVVSSRPRRPRSPEDVYRTAIHEAGHLVLFGTRTELPESLTVTVYRSIGEHDEYRGLVSQAAKEAPDVKTQRDLHWSMLMNLAGSEAEAIVFGDRADGALGDNARWLSVANVYLGSGFGEVFYIDVASDAQRDHNRAVLNTLKATCQARLQVLLLANRELLEELAAAIVEHGTMGVEQLRPFLARVVEPRGAD